MTKENEKTEQSSVADVAEEVVAVQKDPVRRITKIVLIAVAFVFVWYVIADRHAPWSDQARIHSYVIPVVPQVSGRIVDVDVEKDQVVDAGKMLFRIDASDDELAVETAESSLELAGQEIGAGVATVVTAQAQLVVAETNLEHIQAQSARVFEMEKNKFSQSLKVIKPVLRLNKVKHKCEVLKQG